MLGKRRGAAAAEDSAAARAASPSHEAGVPALSRWRRQVLGDERDDTLIGRTIPGGYRIVERIAEGGMGRIYRAEQTALGRPVAVKVIHPALVSDELSVVRFVREARTASRLQHPNSVAIHDFGRTDDGLLYLVMELLQGEDLARIIAREGPLPIPRAVGIVRQALAAIDEAHACSIVHRDIKPDNFVVETTRWGHDHVKLVDFGIAKMRRALADPKGTQPGIVCGTPEYMSPEQARGEPLDGRSDLYSVGVVLYELLTGRLPFDEPDRGAVVEAQIGEVPADPREIAPERGIPEKLAAVVLRTLAKRPEDRPATARDLADALDDAVGGEPWSERVRRTVRMRTEKLRTPLSWQRAETLPLPRRRAPWRRGALLALGVGGAGAAVAWAAVGVVHAAAPAAPAAALVANAAGMAAAIEPLAIEPAATTAGASQPATGATPGAGSTSLPQPTAARAPPRPPSTAADRSAVF
jgi:serine/threonine-protein kinase